MSKFTPNTPRPAGSGMQKGQQTAKTLAKTNAHAMEVAEVKRLCKLHAGKSAAEIMDALDYDPIIHGVVLALSKHTTEATVEKLVKTLTTVKHPSLKSMEVKGEQITTIRVVFGQPDETVELEGVATPLTTFGNVTEGSEPMPLYCAETIQDTVPVDRGPEQP